MSAGWTPSPGPQTWLLQCPVFEVLFGGARGGGKTDGMLGEWLSHAAEYGAAAIGLMVRRTLVELTETIMRSQEIFPHYGAAWNEQKKMWRFPNGARITFAYLDRDVDAMRYQGHNYSRIYIEEAGNFPSRAPIDKLKATLRSPKGVRVGMRLTANPGGPGHSWIKDRFIVPHPAGMKRLEESFTNPFTGVTRTVDRVFIPSKLKDNPYLGDDYVARLQMAGSEALVRAWLMGDWDVVEGAFFDEWRAEKHVVKPFVIPKEWLRFRALDWGFAAPYACLWFAVASDAVVVNNIRGDACAIPRGALVVYRELYGGTEPGVGSRENAEEVARKIVEIEKNDPVVHGVIDPATYGTQSGPSIAERMAASGAPFLRADNTRVGVRGALNGWDAVRGRLRGEGDVPMLYVVETARNLIRTLPVLQHDPDRPEDLNTDGEDHAADALRYGCLSRPWVRKLEIKKRDEPLIYTAGADGRIVANKSVAEIVEERARRRRAED